MNYRIERHDRSGKTFISGVGCARCASCDCECLLDMLADARRRAEAWANENPAGAVRPSFRVYREADNKLLGEVKPGRGVAEEFVEPRPWAGVPVAVTRVEDRRAA